MFGFHPPPQSYQPAAPAATPHFRREDVTLELRQQPKEALVTAEGKEKARKPVDPPPIIQLFIEPRADPQQHFLQSPYLFMCTSLFKVNEEDQWNSISNKFLAGSLVSSLHRLKDIDNKDGGFFVFGDISIKIQGTFRLKFSLFDLHKDSNEVQYLGSITSDPFKVMLPKDFKGMDESTYLSRAFSDQGVRLRLRKEPRAIMGNKRGFTYGQDTPTSATTPVRANAPDFPYEETSVTPNKRFRAEGEDRRDKYSDQGPPSATSLSSSYASPPYGPRQPNMTGPYSMPMSQYPSLTGLNSATMGPHSPYSFRPGTGNTSGYYGDSLLATSNAGSLSSIQPQQRYADMQQAYSPLYQPPVQRPNTGMSFADDNPSYAGYRTPTMSAGDNHRPESAIGMAPAMSLAPQQSQQQQNDSLDSSRGAFYSHSPELTRSGGFSDRLQLGHNMGSNSLAMPSLDGLHTTRLDEHSMSTMLPSFQHPRNDSPDLR